MLQNRRLWAVAVRAFDWFEREAALRAATANFRLRRKLAENAADKIAASLKKPERRVFRAAAPRWSPPEAPLAQYSTLKA